MMINGIKICGYTQLGTCLILNKYYNGNSVTCCNLSRFLAKKLAKLNLAISLRRASPCAIICHPPQKAGRARWGLNFAFFI